MSYSTTIIINMKRVVILFLFALTHQIGLCQKYYKCNRDNVAVRVAPGVESEIFYIATPYYGCEVGEVYIPKGFVFMSKGSNEEGYTKIYNMYSTICWDEGWIPSDCLSPALKCLECKGKGTNGKKCEICDGLGDWTCCQYKGKEVCKRCKGIGYI